jgi:hypothetical protein
MLSIVVYNSPNLGILGLNLGTRAGDVLPQPKHFARPIQLSSCRARYLRPLSEQGGEQIGA